MAAAPDRRRLQDQAREAGARARAAGQDRAAPPFTGAARSLERAWLEGYDQGGPPDLRVQEPPRLQVREVPEPAGHWWPEGRPLPGRYRAASIPCPGCRRLQIPDGGRAAVVQATDVAVVYLRCRGCGARWKLPR